MLNPINVTLTKLFQWPLDENSINLLMKQLFHHQRRREVNDILHLYESS